jgi:cytochrome c
MNKLTLSVLAVLASSAAASGALAQDVAAGKTSFNKCLPCHAIGEGAKNKVGPELNGIDGRKSGTAPDYNYSDGNKTPASPGARNSSSNISRTPKPRSPAPR